MVRKQVQSVARRFPTERLRPRRGEIYAYVFENKKCGVPLGVYWNFFLHFRRLRHRGETLGCALLADWATPDVRDWRDLEGIVLRGAAARMLEGSFYVGEHDPLTRMDIRIGERRGRAFRVQWDVTADFAGWFEDEADSALRVVAHAWMDFDGISLSPHYLPRGGAGTQGARDMFERFVNISAFGVLQREPRLNDDRRYLLRPTRARKVWTR